jgi:hypothetical protein
VAGPLLLGAGGDPAEAREWARGVPLVLDVPPGDLCHLAASLADLVVLVAGRETLSALAEAVRASLGSVAAAIRVVENMAEPDSAAGAWPAVPRSSVAARLARAGLPAPGGFGIAIAELAACVLATE